MKKPFRLCFNTLLKIAFSVDKQWCIHEFTVQTSTKQRMKEVYTALKKICTSIFQTNGSETKAHHAGALTDPRGGARDRLAAVA